jgi:hypothetical protein
MLSRRTDRITIAVSGHERHNQFTSAMKTFRATVDVDDGSENILVTAANMDDAFTAAEARIRSLIPAAIDVVVRVVQAYSGPVRAHPRELVKSGL